MPVPYSLTRREETELLVKRVRNPSTEFLVQPCDRRQRRFERKPDRTA
jgi:hypothetical protein